jgi:hypothetical protein
MFTTCITLPLMQSPVDERVAVLVPGFCGGLFWLSE